VSGRDDTVNAYRRHVDRRAAGLRERTSALHERFVAALGDHVLVTPTVDSLRQKPIEIECRPPLPTKVRLYVFNCTDHPSERKAGDYRIQLRLPGQQKRQRGQLAMDGGSLVLLAGYVADFDVFVLWDARAHASFPYSKGIQVGASTVHQAAINGHCSQQRGLRSRSYLEQVLAVRTDRLVEGLRLREELTRSSLLESAAGEPS
jgi:hypothetical protein